jgi:tRNA U34 5-methylaminomethyl-2-thiouridine-forming methyltransferase MnmC
MSQFKRIPPGHRPVETGDGSLTLYSEAFQEACHSPTGARAETLLHYVDGCRIVDRAGDHDPFRILEVGFGLGVGLLTTLEAFPRARPLHFVSLEIDRNLLEWFREEYPELALRWDRNRLRGTAGNVEIDVLCGDARETLPEELRRTPREYHAVYQDAFSPRRNPRLWTLEWFALLRGASHPSVILSTYSASTSIRKALHAAGWGVQQGVPFGPKRSSTRAVLNRPTDQEILLQLDRAPVPPLSDLRLQGTSSTIEE